MWGEAHTSVASYFQSGHCSGYLLACVFLLPTIVTSSARQSREGVKGLVSAGVEHPDTETCGQAFSSKVC